MTSNRETTGFLLSVVFVCLAAGRDVYFGALFQRVDPLTVALTAFTLCTLVFLPVALATDRGGLARLRRHARTLAWINATSAIAWLSFFHALRMGEPALVQVIFFGIGPLSVTWIDRLVPGAAPAARTLGERRLHAGLLASLLVAVAVMLGAQSLTKGLRQLDDLSRVADESRQIVATTTVARQRLLRSEVRLAAEERRLTRALTAAREAEREVAAAAASRLAYISSLRAQEKAAQVRSVVATAQQAQQTSQQLQPTTTPPPPTGPRQLVVSATCYDLPGKTATGMPVGIGVVAVDPSVIPLGTRMYVPGYGNAVAADVGGAIKGAVIDLWMPASQCMAWGRRTVTITLR